MTSRFPPRGTAARADTADAETTMRERRRTEAKLGTTVASGRSLPLIGRRQPRDHRKTACEPLHEGLREAHVREIEISGIDSEVIGCALDAEAPTTRVQIEPTMHLVEL